MMSNNGVIARTEREYFRRKKISAALIVLAAICIYWSSKGTGFAIRHLFTGIPNIIEFLVEDLLPPNFAMWRRFWQPTLETVAMSYAGTFFAVVISFPLGFLAARNTAPTQVVMQVTRAFAVFMRTIPAVVWAMLLVSAVGLGPLAGSLALGLGGAGMLIKSYADSIEEVDKGQVEAVVATGATGMAVLARAVIPQFLPGFVSWSLYRFDLNLRSAAIVGLVGAGGIGFTLQTTIKLFQYKQAAVAILWILALILVIEFITAKLRERII